MNVRQAISRYYRLAKPGIVYGNAIAFIAGYFVYTETFAIDWLSFAMSLLGICLVMASSCVANNMYDQDMDSMMARTKNRALVVQTISMRSAAIYSAVLLVLGVMLLYVYGGLLSAILVVVGWIAYAIVYTRAKRVTRHATLIGTIPGALPPVIGYVAAGGYIDMVAGLLFVAMMAWQMPHFYAIALFRKKDYQQAKIPVTPIVMGDHRTKLEMQWYAGLFIVASLLLGYWIGLLYLFITAIMCIWIIRQLTVSSTDITKWARTQFKTSLIVLLIWSVSLVIGSVL